MTRRGDSVPPRRRAVARLDAVASAAVLVVWAYVARQRGWWSPEHDLPTRVLAGTYGVAVSLWMTPALPPLSRWFAAANCLTFAVRVRVLRGGRLVVAPPECPATFAVDFPDRLVYWPLSGLPRVYLKRRAAVVHVPWSWC